MQKLDKAEVLEQAVRYLTMLHNRGPSNPVLDPSAQRQAGYTAGFTDCVRETVLYLDKTGGASKNSIGELNSYLRHVCDTKGAQKNRDTRCQPRLDLSTQFHFTSTPVTSRDTQLSTGTFLRNASFIRDSASPVLEHSVLNISVDVTERTGDLSHLTFSGGSSGSLDFTNSSVSSASPMSVLSSADDSVTASLRMSSAVGGNDSTGSDVVLNAIVKEELPWRPW